MCPARCVEKDIDVAAESLKVAEAFRIHTFIATSPMHIATKLRSTRMRSLNARFIW